MSRIKGITVEINGNVTKLSSALKEVESKSRDLNSQLKQINTSLKFNPGNTELLTQKQRVLGEQVANTKEKLELLKKAQEDAVEALAKGEIGQEQYDALRREIIKTENQLKNFEKEIKNSKKSIGELGKSVQEFGDRTIKKGWEISKTWSAGATAVGSSAVKAFTEVKKGMDIVIQKTGATGKAAQELKKSFENVFTEMPVTAEQVGNALGEVNTQFGATGKELEELTKNTLEYSKVTGVDQTAAVLSAKKIMEQYGGTVADVPKILDALAKAGQDTGADINKVSEIMSKNAVQIQALGFDYSQAALLIGKVSQAGFDETKVLAGLTKAQVEFAKQGNDMSAGLQDLEKRIQSATTEHERINIATEVFGTRNGPLMAKVLEQGVLDWKHYANATENAKGTVVNTFGEMMTPLEKMQVTLNKVLVPMAEFGAQILEILAPAFVMLGDAIKEVSDWIRDLDPMWQKTAAGILLAIAAAGPMMIIFGGLIKVLGGLISVFGGIVGGVLRVGNILTTTFPGAAKVASGALTTLVDKFKVANSASSGFLSPAIAAPAVFVASLAGIGAGLYALEQKFGIFSSQRQAEIEEYKSSLDEASFYTYEEWDGIEGYTIDRWGNITKMVANSGDTIFGTIKDRFSKAKAEATGQTGSMAEQIANKYTELKQRVTEQIEQIKNTTVAKTGEASTSSNLSVAEMARNMQAKFAEIKNSGDTNFSSLSQRIAERMENIKQRVQQGMEALKRAVNVDLGKPRLKLPHITTSGKFNLETNSTPSFSVEWYRKGGIFTTPSIIGVGEAGSEAVLPIDRLVGIMAKVMQRIPTSGGTVITGNSFVVREEADIRKVAEELYRLEMQEKRARGLR